MFSFYPVSLVPTVTIIEVHTRSLEAYFIAFGPVYSHEFRAAENFSRGLSLKKLYSEREFPVTLGQQPVMQIPRPGN